MIVKVILQYFKNTKLGSLASINIKFKADLSGFSTEVQNASRQVEQVGKTMQKVGGVMSLAFTAPLTLLGKQAFTTFADFEDGMAKVKAISGATSSEFEALKKNAEDLGASTRYTATEVAGLQLNYSKLGFKPDEILAATQATLDLALATGEDLAKSATVAASTIKGFGLSANDTVRVTDVMAKSFSSSALDLEKFSTAMGVLAPVASTAGVSLEEATGLLSVLVNAGVDASTAGTGLRNIFLDLSESGLTLEQAFEKIQTSTNKNKTAMDLFGKRGATVATVLANNIDKAQGLTDTYKAATGSTAEMAKIMDATSKGGLARMNSALEGLASSFGEQLAPFIADVADWVGELATKFNSLEGSTKKIIVIVGGLVAAIGPLVLVIGTVLTLIPNMIVGFAAVKGAILSVTSVIAANPFGAMAIALGAIVSTVIIASSRFSDLTNATKEFEQVNAKATETIAKEKTELEKNLAVAKDEKASKEDRKKAIENLNKLSPEYLGNISLENIYTKETTDSVKKYNEALLTKAKILAAQEKLVEVQKKLLDLQLGQSDAAKPTIWQNLGNALVSYGNSTAFAYASAKTMAENLGTEYSELDKLKNLLVAFLGENNALVSSNNEVATSIDAVVSSAEKLPKAGTIAFYEAEISKLQKLQKETSTTKSQYAILQNGIDEFQSKIKEITDPFKSFEGPELNTIAYFDAQISELKRLQQETVRTSAAYVAMSDKIKSLENQKLQIIDPAALIKNSDYFKSMVDKIAADGERLKGTQEATNAAMKAKAEELNEAYGIIGDSFVNLFSSYTNGFVESLGIANEGMKAFVQGLVGTITKLITMSLAASQASVIQGAAQSGTATGPAAVFTTPAFIATAIAGIISAFASIPKFETGGIVGGASYYGDKILARVNSGELILNSQQQRKLFGMMDSSASGVAVELGLGTRISGSDIELVVERAMTKNNRKR